MSGLCRRVAVATGAVVLLLGPVVGVASAAGAAAGTGLAAGGRALFGDRWGTAEEVPGTAALNQGGIADVFSVSCASAGNCSAGSFYTDSSSHAQAYVVSQVNGSWGTAIEVPGTAALDQGGEAVIISVSCATAGNCSAGGWYGASADHGQAFVVSQTGGRWGKAEEVPGTATLNKGGNATIISVSCASAGNCSAGGYYTDSAGRVHPFVVSQVHGTWGKAKGIPVGAGDGAEVTSVSCASPGNCSAGGYYADGTTWPVPFHAFVISQVGGTWGTAMVVPGTGTSRIAAVGSVSCASAGNCSAGGSYTDNGHTQAFVVSQVYGTWGTAKEVPGIDALSQAAAVGSVSCASAGHCSAGGSYTDSSGSGQAFVVSQTGGRWGKAEEVPGTAALNKGGNATINSVSCASAGHCSAAGSYTGSSGGTQAFVVSQVNSTWGNAIEVPGTAALSKGGDAGVESVSCAPAGHCSAGGFYTDSAGHMQAFVVSQT